MALTTLPLACLLAAAPAVAPAVAPSLALTHATVIDPGSGGVLADGTVVVTDGRIVEVRPSRSERDLPPGARVVDAKGRYVIPGLWDAHVHLSWTSPSALPILVANGVTTVRDLGSRLAEIDDWRARAAAGVLVGPRVFRAGPILNGQSFNEFQMVPGGPEETRGAVRALKAAGVDFVKIHRRLPRDSFLALAAEARQLGLPLVGHIPTTVSPEEAIDVGMGSIEHAETFFEGTFRAGLGSTPLPAALARFRSAGAPALVARLAERKTAVTPTLVAYRSLVEFCDPARPADPRTRYVAASQRREWEGKPRPSSEECDQVRTTSEELLAFTAQMHAAGVELLAGTDAAGPRLPGFPLHDELALLVAAGLSPLEALASATSRPAKMLGRTDLGVVRPGALADLVVLEADPLADIANTRKIHGVVLGGRLLDRPALAALLEEGAALAAQH